MALENDHHQVIAIADGEKLNNEEKIGEVRNHADSEEVNKALFKSEGSDHAYFKLGYARYVLYVLCFLSGQLAFTSVQVSPSYYVLNALSLITVGYSIGIIGASMAFNIYLIAYCPYYNCGFIDIANSTSNDSDMDLTAIQPDNTHQYRDFKKLLSIFASFSGTMSYIVMIFVLVKTYDCPIKKLVVKYITKKKYKRLSSKAIILNPFSDNDKFYSTALFGNQILYFYLIFFFNVALFIASASIFFIIYYKESDHDRSWKRHLVNVGGLASQFYVWGCAILSCFIFSKVAYSVHHICTVKLFDYFNKIASCSQINLNVVKQILTELNIMEDENDEMSYDELLQHKNPHLELLKIVDKWYSHILEHSLYPYSKWFAIHWIMYTLTGFLSLAYVIEFVLIKLYSKHSEFCEDCHLVLVYIFLFSFHHCILFIYPCYRAASITAARFTLIKKVSNANWSHVSLVEKQVFIQYLKDQNSTFKVSILCAKLSFGFELAYFSIFLGIMSVVLKIIL